MCLAGLKTGWTQGGNIMAAVISMSIFKVIKPSKIFTVQEANICQTVAVCHTAHHIKIAHVI
jgi:uncharacterized oligopeptide transporter (OPT) family protein